MAEDKAAISDLYPASSYQSTKGSIHGRVLQTNGRDGITGVNVIARNLDNPYADAVSAMSGDYVRVEAGDDGTFTINGLTPGARYTLYTDMMGSQLPVPANFRSARATGVSDDRSMVIGWHDRFGPRSAIRWENGQMFEFGTPTFPV